MTEARPVRESDNMYSSLERLSITSIQCPFWLLFSVLSTVVTFYFLKHDPGLVERRLKVCRRTSQKRAPLNDNVQQPSVGANG